MKTQTETREELESEFFHGRVDRVAKNLLGKLLINGENGCGGMIVETEAYLGKEDPSSHIVKAGEKREPIFEKGAGTVYVFKIYHHSNLNFISEYNGMPEGILVRAIEPVQGVDKMRERRGVEDAEKIASGPGRLTEAMGISKEEHNSEKLEESSISLYRSSRDPEVEVSRRIGISEARDWPLRFTVKDNRHVSASLNRDVDESFDIDHFL